MAWYWGVSDHHFCARCLVHRDEDFSDHVNLACKIFAYFFPQRPLLVFTFREKAAGSPGSPGLYMIGPLPASPLAYVVNGVGLFLHVHVHVHLHGIREIDALFARTKVRFSISVNLVRTLFLLHTLKMVCAPHNTSSRFLSKAANPIIFGFIYAVHLQVRSIYSIRCTQTKKSICAPKIRPESLLPFMLNNYDCGTIRWKMQRIERMYVCANLGKRTVIRQRSNR